VTELHEHMPEAELQGWIAYFTHLNRNAKTSKLR
jgi:hypothetical protein